MIRKIVMIDDDGDFVDATTALLETKGYRTVTAPDGDKGYALIKREKPDLVLLDVMMTHDTEGFDVARKLKEDPETKSIPIIMISGVKKVKALPFTFEPDNDWLPVKMVLEKPVRPDVLLKAVEDALKE